jgi:hypothetical protein
MASPSWCSPLCPQWPKDECDRTCKRITEVKRDLGGTPPFGWRIGESGELVPTSEQQAAIRRMRELKGSGAKY